MSLALKFITVVDESGVLLGEYPKGVLGESLLVGAFIQVLDALSRASDIPQIDYVSSTDFIGVVDKAKKKCKIFSVFDSPPRIDRERFLEPFRRFIVSQINSVLKNLNIQPGLIDRNTIAVITDVLENIYKTINSFLEAICILDLFSSQLSDIYKERTTTIIQSICENYSDFIYYKKDGFYLRGISQTDILLSILDEIRKKFEAILEHEKTLTTVPKDITIIQDFEDAVKQIFNVFGERTADLFASILSGQDIVVVADEIWREIFLRAISIFQIVPYICCYNLDALYTPLASVIAFVRDPNKLKAVPECTAIVDLVNKKLSNLRRSSVCREICGDIEKLINRQISPVQLYDSLIRKIDDLKATAKLIHDIIIPPKAKIDESVIEPILELLARYKDPDTIRMIFSIISKWAPKNRVYVFNIYKRCIKELFPTAKLME